MDQNQSSALPAARRSLFDRFAYLLHAIGAALTVLVGGIVVLDAFLRNVVEAPMLGAAELVANAMVLLVFFQVPWVILTRRVLRATLLVDQLPASWARISETVAFLTGALFFFVISLRSIEPALAGFARSEYFGSVLFKIPAWPLRFGTLALWIVSGIACLVVAVRVYRTSAAATQEQIPTGEEAF
ncbi:MAG: TRAP transporter small permease subunit [Pseudomonadota bacterium]|nr:TRAP transporter small permease subunit [Pseudomonadota bacterium]